MVGTWGQGEGLIDPDVRDQEVDDVAEFGRCLWIVSRDVVGDRFKGGLFVSIGGWE